MTRTPDRDEGEGAAARPALPVEEMGGDPACWLGLVEDHRDAVPAPADDGEGGDADEPGGPGAR